MSSRRNTVTLVALGLTTLALSASAPAASAATLDGTVTWNDPSATYFAISVSDPITGDFLGYCDSSFPECALTSGFSAGYQLPISAGSGSYTASVALQSCNQQSCLFYAPTPPAPFDAPTGHHDIAVPANDWGFVRIHALAPSGVTISSIQVAGVGGFGAYGSFSAWSAGPQAGDSVTFRVPAGDLSFVSGIQVINAAQTPLTVPFVDLTGLSVQPGQTTTVDVQTWSNVTGTIRWPNAFSAKGCKIIDGSCQLAPDGWSATYNYAFDPNNFSDAVQVVAHIGTCAGDPFSCADQGGSRLTFTVGIAAVVPGGTSHLDGVLDPSFQLGQICGKVTASSGTMTGGVVRFETNRFRPNVFVGSSVGTTFGPNGNYCTQIASSDYGTMTATPTITQCTAMNPSADQSLVTIPDGGHVTEDATLSGYSTAPPGSLSGVAQVAAFPAGPGSFVFVDATGPDNLFACAGGMSGRQDYFGQPGPFGFSNLVSGTWNVFGQVSASTFGTFYSEWDYFFPARPLVVQPNASTAVNFAVNGPTVALPVRVDLGRWQKEVGDSVSVTAGASTNDGRTSSVLYLPTGSAAVQEPVYLDSASSWSTANIATSLDSTYSDFGSSNIKAAITSPFRLTSSVHELPGGSQLGARGLGYWTVLLPAAVIGNFVIEADWKSTTTSAGVPFTEVANAGMEAMHAKLPPATHTGPFRLQWFDWSTESWNSLDKNLAVELADYDEVVQDLDGPQISNRSPQPDSYCPQGAAGNCKKGNQDSRGGTTILVSANVSLAKPLAGVTIAGKTVAVGKNGAVSGTALLKLGRQAIEIAATDTLGNKTSWKRTYTLPTELNGLASPMAALVSASTPVNKIPLPSKPIKLGSTLPLKLTVTSCGILQKNADMFVSAPRIISITRDGQQVLLHDVDPNVAADGIRFQGSQGGDWTLSLKTKGLPGVGTYVLTIAAPDGTRKVAAFVAAK
jgi:hypothetical protein